jgi:hypothetical protein
MPTRTDRILWEVGRQERVEPFWLKFTEDVSSNLDFALRDGRKVLSPDFVMFHPVHRGLTGGISKVLNFLSRNDIDTYGRLRAVPSVATSSMGADSPEIPCLTFFSVLPEEEAAAASRRLVEAGAGVFTNVGLPLPTGDLPQILEAALELQDRPPIG